MLAPRCTFGIDPLCSVPTNTPRLDVCAERIVAEYRPGCADRLKPIADVVTYEFENVPVSAVEQLVRHVPVRPAQKR